MKKYKNNNKNMYVSAFKISGISFMLLASAFGLILTGMPASAETYAVHTWVYPDDGEVIRVNLLPATTSRTPISRLNFSGGDFAYAFCTDVHHNLNSTSIMYLDDDFFSEWRVSWLVNNYPPSKSSRVQQAARQAALWHFSDGYDLDQDNPTTEDEVIDDAVRNAYRTILASIPDTPPPEYELGNINIIINPASETAFLPGEAEQSITVRLTKGGYPLEGYVINVSSTFGVLDRTSNVTNSGGEATFTITSNFSGTANISAEATVVLPAGSRFINKDDPLGKQRLVLGEAEKVTIQDQAMKSWIESENLIIAHKFEDKNYNGVQDSNENNLPHWQFTLSSPDGSSHTSWTDRDGNAYFYDKIVGNGIYTLTEVLKEGWKNSTPISQSRNHNLRDEWTRWVANFGNAKCSIIKVIKFLDKNMDGLWNEEIEPVLPEWQFALYDKVHDEWTQYDGGTTGSDGSLTFSNLDDEKHYKVVENLAKHPGYWINTSPLEQVVEWSSYPNQYAVVKFGNIEAIPSIDVTKKVWNGISWTDHYHEDIGEIVTFNLTIFNNGTTPLTNFWINDTLPEHLNYVNESTKAPVSSDVKHVKWFFDGPLIVNSSIYLEFNATVTSSGESANTVNASAFCVTTNRRVSDEDEATVEGEEPGIRIEKSVQYNGEWTELTHIDRGDDASFRLTVINNGDESLINVYVNDTLPHGLSNNSWPLTDTYSQHISKLAIGETKTYYFNATVTQTGLITNTVIATAKCENTSKNVYDEDNATVEGETPGIKIEKNVWENNGWSKYAYVNNNTEARFKLTITNNGTNPLINIRVNDTLPEGLVNNTLGSMFSQQIDKLKMGESKIFYFNATVIDINEPMDNKAIATGTCVHTGRKVLDEDEATVEGEEPGIRIEKSVQYNGEWTELTHIDRGDDASFRLTVINNGDESLINVYVNDTLPHGLSNNSWPLTDTYSQHISKLAIGETKTYYFNATVTQTGLITNTVIATAKCENTSKNVYDEDNATVEGEERIIPSLNHPPNKPINPSPPNGATDISINPTLSVTVSDPDEDIMDVSFYTASGTLIGTDKNVLNGRIARVVWYNLEHNELYSWYVIVSDGEYSTTSSTWSFSTIPSLATNHPPNKPINPSPPNGATDISINPTLSVTVSDPDEDIMDVSFYTASGTLIGTDKNVSSGSIASIVWHNLNYETTYSWYATTNDGEYTTVSSNWNFTTKTGTSSGADNDSLWWALIIILVILGATLLYVKYVLLAKKRK